MNLKGKIIAIEGLDGVGKTTQINLLRKYLKKVNIQCEFIHFPRVDQSPHGLMIARFLRGEFGGVDDVHPQLIAMLFALDRNDSKNELLKAIELDKVILLDRYVYSNVAFQCAKLLEIKDKEALRDWIFNYEFNFLNLPRASVNFFLDAPIDFIEKNLKNHRIGIEREYLNGMTDIHESSMNLQRNVYTEYQKLVSSDLNLHHIQCYDAKENKLYSPEIIHKKICDKLDMLCPQ